MQLWNTLNKDELEKKWRESGFKFVTISFYQYHQIKNPQILRDKLFLELIVNNLVSNACKFSPDNSVVTIKTYQEDDSFVISVNANMTLS